MQEETVLNLKEIAKEQVASTRKNRRLARIKAKQEKARVLKFRIFSTAIASVIIFAGVYWFASNYYLQSPITLKFQPLWVKRGEVQNKSTMLLPSVRTAYAEEPEVVEVKEKTIEDMICDPKFKWDCKIIIAIAKSENGYEMYGNTWGADRTYKGNSNGSVDTGIFMINSVHGYSTEYLQDAKNNIGVAYKVWLSQGYEAWSDFLSKKYLKYLN